ncbi:endonuclease/exonuclease/phosphatase family protein [Nocardia sp. NPDC020380]|uniref:endonuclease/exonuclease/phosphatase family protein n=1 Tax=Nocardia sp. NPDC020380 TaxID=3364309 RepID=UPI0037A7AAF0
MITVVTWNVLHRIHADNWASEIADRWPGESDRIAAVTARVRKRPERIIALQEVSGDQLASLRLSLPDRVFHVLDYPRVPRPRRLADPLADRSESLVLIADADARLLTAEPFATDPGKGLLAVEADGITVVATHVTGDTRRGPQLARLAEVAAAGPSILLGDFNVDRAVLADALGPEFTVPAHPYGSVPTRPRTAGAKSQFIDHVVAHGVPVRDLQVEDVAGESDHNLVTALVG